MKKSVRDADIFSWWEETAYRLQADYSSVIEAISFNGGADELAVRLGDVVLDMNDFCLYVNGKHCYFEEIGMKGGLLAQAAENNREAMLELVMSEHDAPYLRVSDAINRNVLAFVTSPEDMPGKGMIKYDESLLLADAHQLSLLGQLKERFPAVEAEIQSSIKKGVDGVYRTYNRTREDEMIRNLSFNLINGDETFLPEQMYRLTYLMEPDRLELVKKETMSQVTKFFHEAYELGEFESRDDIESLISHARKGLDSYLSEENLLMGKLSFRVMNVLERNEEVQSDDIARIAVLGEKDPVYSPYVDKIDGWVKSEARQYGLKEDVVNLKRERLGGKVGMKPVRPEVPKAVKEKAGKRFMKI